MINTPTVSLDWLNYGMDDKGRLTRVIEPEGSVKGTEQVGPLTLHRIRGAVDEKTLDAVLENLKTLGVELPSET